VGRTALGRRAEGGAIELGEVHADPGPEASAGTPRPEGGRDQLVAALFDAHWATLCRVASLLLDDPSVAEEVVQEAFARTYAGWWRIRRPERASAYLRAAVVNECRSRGRRRATERRGNRTVWATDGGADDDRARHEDQASAEVLTVLAAVRALPPRQREAVVLTYYQDLPEAEVAASLRCSVGTVKSQLSKARATLAASLGPQVRDA